MSDQLNFQERFNTAAQSLGLRKQAKAAEPVPIVETVQGDERDKTVAISSAARLSSPTAKNIFQHPEAHPFVLDLLLLRHYGSEWLMWEPEIVELRVRTDLGHPLSDANLHKIQAIKTLHFVDTFWLQWEVFVWCTMALNGVPPDFYIMQVPTVSQCMIAVDIANRIRQDVTWSDEVKAFISNVFIHDDIFYPIEPLDFVTVPWEEYPVDVPAIQKQWPAVRISGKAPTDISVTSEQLRRLLEVRGYLEDSRAQLREQLVLVANV